MRPNPLTPLLVAALLAAASGEVAAQLLTDLPPEMQGVGIDDKSGNIAPLHLRFRDEHGKGIALGDIISGQRPVLLSLNYSDCPMLCGLQLNGLIDSMKKLKLSAGKDFDLICVSVDPLEPPTRARMTEKKVSPRVRAPRRRGGLPLPDRSAEEHHRFGQRRRLPLQVRPRDRRVLALCRDDGDYPSGIISRYLYGVMYDPQTLRLSLVEAGEGKIGSPAGSDHPCSASTTTKPKGLRPGCPQDHERGRRRDNRPAWSWAAAVLVAARNRSGRRSR